MDGGVRVRAPTSAYGPKPPFRKRRPASLIEGEAVVPVRGDEFNKLRALALIQHCSNQKAPGIA
jgi:hypothetical protein